MAKEFNDFKELVAANIIDYLPEEYRDAKAEVHEVIKNNDTVLNSLTIRKTDTGVTPTLYLESYFKAYEEGKPLAVILTKIAETYVSAENNQFDPEIASRSLILKQ